jgi:glutamate 5-kinase
MLTKLEAAQIASSSGIPVIIANSRRKNILQDILSGKNVGTYFKPKKRMPSIKRWIAYGASVKGQIYVNDGAKKAIFKGANLLPTGVLKVIGTFKTGDVVTLIDQNKKEFAKGMTNYNDSEVNRIKGLKTSQIKKELGYIKKKDVIGYKNMRIGEENCDIRNL